jgi:galactokinase
MCAVDIIPHFTATPGRLVNAMHDHVTSFAPGRVNLIGEHTDYNEGLALPFAIAAGVTVTARPLDGPNVEARAVDLGESDSFPLAHPQPAPGWRAFVRGAVAELAAAGVVLAPVSIEITGTVLRGACPSSSAALEVALAGALIALARPPTAGPDRLELARICSRIENDWVGAQTGLLDQIASLHGEPDHAMRIDFRSLDVTPVPLRLGGHALVTLDSGERHAHASSGYNERRAECRQACAQLGIESLRDASLDAANALPEPLNRRARHVITENGRVDDACEALARDDLARLGRLLDASHASLRDDYEVSTPAVEATVARLREAGAIGGRIVGGGFGGHVLGLLPPGAAPPPGALAVSPGPGARLLTAAQG